MPTPNETLRRSHIARRPTFNLHNQKEMDYFYTSVHDLQTQLGRPLKIVELGTRRWNPNFSTHHKNDFSSREIDISNYVMTDYLAGDDVDVIADIQQFTKTFPVETIDVIFSGSTYEHIKYPQLASHELMKSLRQGGLIFIQTHQSFPLHGYPSDYYRFSRVALESLFPKEMGMEVTNSWYTHMNEIVPSADWTQAWNIVAESYSNVYIIAKKVALTPDQWIYDLN